MASSINLSKCCGLSAVSLVIFPLRMDQSRDAILHQARRLGLADGKVLILDSMDELTLAFDLAIHTAPAGRSRAI
ncbi:MAG: hypothetical protein WAM17_02320, partial [Rhodoplanes sp.]